MPVSASKVKKFAFARISRLRLKRDFEAVFDAGKRTTAGELVMWHKPGEEAPSKIGLMVSKKTGGAVRRNRIKRLLREAFRLSQEQLKEGTRLIIYPKAGCAIDTMAQARNALEGIWRKARLIK